MNEDNVKGYGCVVMFAMLVSVLFSCAALLRWDNWECEISPAGFVIGTLSALITFAVGWQIWQFIALKDDVKAVKELTKDVESLKHELDRRSNLLTQRNLEITHLIDAHSYYQYAENAEMKSARYLNYAKALDFFLKSNIPLDYKPLDDTLFGLHDCLDEIIRTYKEDKERFLEYTDELESLYKSMMESIHKREQDIEDIRQDIINIRDRRKALSNIFSRPKASKILDEGN